jgi:deoxyribodipyrimidine photo-lyase
MIQKERIQFLNEKPVRSRDYLLYWMQASQREEYNHALEYAVEQANRLNKPLVVYFGLTENFPEANWRHYRFMLEGLRNTDRALAERGILLVVRAGSPEKGAADLSRKADLVVVDRGYLDVQRAWRKKAAEAVDCALVQVESDVVVPVEEASVKEEYSAATLRPRIKKHWPRYLTPLKRRSLHIHSTGLSFDRLNLGDLDGIVARMRLNRKVTPVSGFCGGTDEANKHLKTFLNHRITLYDSMRNDPSRQVTSDLSPYLHFGQISPLKIALNCLSVQKRHAEGFLEELLVRRELSINFVYYNSGYSRYACLPAWAARTLEEHKNDPRPVLYTMEQLENAETNDPYWNAAQKEMVVRGKMHGYMRMYWGKKILEWSPSPEEGFYRALELNNRYELDGRDPNGFTGIAWCFGKHDRAWTERPVFGKVRYMNANGLKRKFDIEAYVKYVDGLVP